MKLGEGPGKEYRMLPLSAKLRKGDRRLYVDHYIGMAVAMDELHLTVSQAGYYGVVRKKKRKK